MRRRLAAILAADVVGYSRLMGEDETGTLERLKSLRKELVQPKITEHQGRIVKLMGDGLLAEFASVVEAVQCAVQIQEQMVEHDIGVPDEQRIRLRIGVNLGDVIVENTDIYGDGVNIAARLEALCEPGEIRISGKVHEEVHGRTELLFEDMGEHEVKNIDRPLRVWRWRSDPVGAAVQTAVSAQRLPLPDKPSIAVLPFSNMSGDTEQEYFSDGITEDIITELSRFRNLFVIARNSSFTYKARSVKVQDVGRNLGVEFVVEGSVRKAGNRIRVTAQLVEASTGNHLWADRYDRKLEDIFAVQDDITESIVSCLPARLEDVGTSKALRKRTASMTAYDHLLLGIEKFRCFARKENAEARRLFEKAIQIDPLYARAYALLAATHVWDAMADFADVPMGEAFQTIQTALSLDHEDAWSHAILGFLLFLRREDGDAEVAFRRAVGLNANDADVAAYWSNVLVYLGRCQDALNFIGKALRLNPHPPRWYHLYHALALFSDQKYEEAISAIRRIGPNFAPAHAYAASCQGHLGQIENAKLELAAFTNATEIDREHHDQHPNRTASLRLVERAARYRVPDDGEHFLAGLRKAGLSV
jgi:adenylate cyclase